MFLEYLIKLILLPLQITGLILNFIPYKIPESFTKKIKDAQFHSTAKWGAGMVLFTFYYLIILILAIIFIPVWWLIPLIIIVLPFLGKFTFDYYIYSKKLWARLRYSWGVIRHDKQIVNLQKLRKSIIRKMDLIASGHTKI